LVHGKNNRATLTSSVLDHFVDLLLSVHTTKIEAFHNGATLKQLWVVVWWRRKLLEHLPAHARRRLLLPYDRTVTKVALHEEDHLLVPHKDFVAANVVKPSLQICLCASLVFIRAHAG
jgi:hypothetical protein